jgi:hypothetical protein
MASHQKAGKAQLQARSSLAGLQTLQSKAVVKRPRFSAAEHRLQPAQMRMIVAAAQSADSLGMASLARRLRPRVPVNRGSEKNADNPDSINLRPQRLPVQVRAKREMEESQRKVPMVNLAASREVDRLLQLSAAKRNRNGERKRVRGPHRHEDHSN